MLARRRILRETQLLFTYLKAHILLILISFLFLAFVNQANAQTQFEFYYLNKPIWENTVYLIEDVFDDKKLFKWILGNDSDKEAFLPDGVTESSSFSEPGDWGEGVVTLTIDSNLEIGTPVRMCLYGSEENFFYQDERCEYTSVSKFRIAMVQIDLSTK